MVHLLGVGGASIKGVSGSDKFQKMFESTGKRFKPSTRGAAERLAEVCKLIEQHGHVPVELYPYNRFSTWDRRYIPRPMYIGRAESPLHYAATLKDEELAQRMIDLVLSGASSVERTKMVDTMDTEQVTPLDAAVHYNNPATVNIFLQHRAQIRPKTFELLLHDAWVPRADNDSATACRILESLLDAGASLQNCELDLSKTIWIDPSKKMFRMFVTRGNLNGGCLNNALGGAIRLGYIDLVELLLQRGADSNFVTVEGETPLMTAVRFCSDADLFDDTFRLLCRHGADVNKVAWP